MTSVGKPIPHDAARGHVCGSAAFIDDYVPRRDELVIDFVGSPCACGRLQRIDLARARTMAAVVGIFTAGDIPGRNEFGPVFADEPFLAAERVSYCGQPVAVIAAETRDAARRARQAVGVDVAEEPPIFSIDAAVAAGQFIGEPRHISRGDFASAWKSAPCRLEGTFTSGGQEQFYLESQAAIAYPDDLGRIVVHSSTQNPTEIQVVVAEVLGLGQHQVVCVCKRMGGAFGGKETQAAIPALMAALVAYRTGRAARVIFNKDDDMKITGKRHPCQTDYRVAFDREGRLLAARFDLYSNGGAFADLSTAVLDRAMLHVDNAYYVPHIEINGRICRTNLPPNTAFRGFGGPQAMAVMENVMQDIAAWLGRDAFEVRRINCYGHEERNVTPYGQIVRDHLLPEIFDRLAESSRYKGRLGEIEEFNGRSPTELRGIAMTPVKFGISFTTSFLNQANALVNVLTDGTIQVSTGATEMGQGVNTKIRQLVADEFGLPVASVQMMETSTEKNHNTSPTAASASTDLNGTAAVQACRAIRERLDEFAAGLLADRAAGIAPSTSHVSFQDGFVVDDRIPHKRIPFGDLVRQARRQRVDLGARGFFATPGVDFNRETGRGTPFLYYTTGCAVSEVTIDRFTGDLRVVRVDLLMDIGQQINPGIDRGQVIGGFIQGMGYVTAEELKYDARGNLLSHSPTTYKIPNVTDVPRIFNVAFIDNPAHRCNLRRSKAVGEPPLMLALSVWAAAKHALSCAAKGALPRLAIPATNEQILRCLRRLSQTSSSGEESALDELPIPDWSSLEVWP